MVCLVDLTPFLYTQKYWILQIHQQPTYKSRHVRSPHLLYNATPDSITSSTQPAFKYSFRISSNLEQAVSADWEESLSSS